LFDVVLDNAGGTIRALADLVAVEMLEFRTERPIHVVILACKSVLALIAKRVELVAPLASIMEPFSRSGGI
jgi:hypothetical protein